MRRKVEPEWGSTEMWEISREKGYVRRQHQNAVASADADYRGAPATPGTVSPLREISITVYESSSEFTESVTDLLRKVPSAAINPL